MADALDYSRQIVECRIAELLALTELRNGKAAEHDIALLKSTVLIARELDQVLSFPELETQDLAPEHYPVMLAMWEQYDALRKTTTRQEYMLAIDRAKERGYALAVAAKIGRA
ncbi:MAG: hypothetical protein K9J77_06020 [Rhodoferax sp.]|nr:hypothetical protein [Rhodoferax sp.]